MLCTINTVVQINVNVRLIIWNMYMLYVIDSTIQIHTYILYTINNMIHNDLYTNNIITEIILLHK